LDLNIATNGIIVFYRRSCVRDNVTYIYLGCFVVTHKGKLCRECIILTMYCFILWLFSVYNFSSRLQTASSSKIPSCHNHRRFTIINCFNNGRYSNGTMIFLSLFTHLISQHRCTTLTCHGTTQFLNRLVLYFVTVNVQLKWVI